MLSVMGVPVQDPVDALPVYITAPTLLVSNHVLQCTSCPVKSALAVTKIVGVGALVRVIVTAINVMLSVSWMVSVWELAPRITLPRSKVSANHAQISVHLVNPGAVVNLPPIA